MRARAFILALSLLVCCAAPGGVEGVRRHYGMKPAAKRADPDALEEAGRWLDAGEVRFHRGGADGYRLAARDAWRWIGTSSGASAQDRERARLLYNHAVAAYALATRLQARPGWTLRWTHNLDLHFEMDTEGRSGFGAPFVLVPDWDFDEFGHGLVSGAHDEVLATTLLLRFDGEHPSVTYHDPLQESHVEVNGRTVLLASHVMAALELRVRAAESEMSDWRRDAALRPAMNASGFSLVEHPRDDKIPILFVHGLQHSPTDFADLIAGLMKEPMLRTRYQFIAYRWATGLPLPISVGIFRRQLGEFWSWFGTRAPRARDRGYWILAHSMGGLLAKTLLVESGDRIIEAMFRVPRNEIDFDSELGRKVERALVYHPDPAIAGVVFMAVPHRGSGFAASAIGDLSEEFIQPDDASRELIREFLEHYGPQLRPEILPLLQEKTTSLHNLRPDDWYLCALGSCPISPDIPYHSVIGDLFGTEYWPVGDGAVAYKSAHLEGAVSETVVRAPHNLHKLEVGLKPVRDILFAYLTKTPRVARPSAGPRP